MARKMKTMDGNSAVAHVSYAFTDVAAIYPITPWLTLPTSSRQWALKTFSAEKYRLRKCSRKAVLPVRFTVRLQPVL